MDHERDDLSKRRVARLSPAGLEVLADLERHHDANALTNAQEPESEELLGRIAVLPPSDREKIAAILKGQVREMVRELREFVQDRPDEESIEFILDAKTHERAAGRPVDPNMTAADAVDILARRWYRGEF